MRKPVRQQQAVPERVDVIALLDKVDFSPEDVQRAACMNTVLYVDSINYRLQCLTAKVEAAMDAKRAYAEADLVVRNTAKANDEKITEGHIKSMLTVDEVVSGAERRREEAELLDEYSKLVVRVFEMRRDMLQIVGKSTAEEMHAGRVLDEMRGEVGSLRAQAQRRFPGGK